MIDTSFLIGMLIGLLGYLCVMIINKLKKKKEERSREMKKIILVVIALLVSSCAYSPRPWTQNEKVALGWSVAASLADMYTTTRALDEEGTYETNPILGKHPSDGEVFVALISSEVITVLIAHYWPDFRIPLLCGKAALNTGFAVHNTRLY